MSGRLAEIQSVGNGENGNLTVRTRCPQYYCSRVLHQKMAIRGNPTGEPYDLRCLLWPAKTPSQENQAEFWILNVQNYFLHLERVKEHSPGILGL